MAYWHSVLLHSANPGKQSISETQVFSRVAVSIGMSYGDVPGNPVLKTLHWACVQSLLGELRSHITVAKKKPKQNPFLKKIAIKRFAPGTTWHNFVFSNTDIKESFLKK